eukprot:1639015-Ditylum_brightwellii.AAC.1
MDNNTKAHQRQYSLFPPSMQHTIDGEGKQMYHNVPLNALIDGTPRQHKTFIKLMDTVVEVIE